MENFSIVIEGSGDLNTKLRSTYKIHKEYLRSVIYMPDHEQYSDLDWNNQSSDAFYKTVKAKPGSVRTAFATTEEFYRVVKPLLDAGRDVLIVAMTSGMSGTFNALRVNSEMILDDYPNRKIIVIDSLKYSAASGMLAIKAAELRAKGYSLSETAIEINKIKYCLHEAGPMDDLRFLAASGRLSAPKAFFGQLAGVQPIADFTYDGKNVPLGTIKGAKKADEFVLKYMEALEDPENPLSSQTIFVVHSNRKERALKFKEMIAKKFSPKMIHVVEVGESCGANIGPGLCCAFFYGKPISKDRSLENAIFAQIKGK